MSIDCLRASFANPFDSEQITVAMARILEDVFRPLVPISPPLDYNVPVDRHGCPVPIDEVLSVVRDLIVRRAVHPRHPHTLAHMVPPPCSISVVADLIIGAMNQCAFIWEEAPMAQAVEREVVRWLRDAIGFGERGGGLITSGGTMSNFLATHLALSRWRQRANVQGRPCILASDQAHVSIEKAAVLNGLARTDVIRARTDSEGRLIAGAITDAAKHASAIGMSPFLIICTGGTTNAGTLEPMEEMLELALTHEAWCHVDAAHGGVMCLAPELLPEGSPVDLWPEADSLSWDAHKGLYASYAIGSLLVRDSSTLEALRFSADYALKSGATADAGLNHFEGSRRFEALKLWMIIEHFSRQGLAQLTAHNCCMARCFARRLPSARFSVLTEPDTNIVCFRYESADRSAAALDKLTAAIQQHAFTSGGPLLSTTVVSERVFMRAVFLNPATSPSDIEQVLKKLDCVGTMLAQEVACHEGVPGH
jgi:L-2,4-diaminobutyrate decarboxylase